MQKIVNNSLIFS